jgi:hypothetical protein
MSIFEQALTQAANTSYSTHPTGSFSGEIVEIIEREIQGRQVFDIKIKTAYGTHRESLWTAYERDLESVWRAKYGDEAEVKLTQTLIRHIKLCTELGLQAPKSDIDLYENIYQLMGRRCRLVVRQGEKGVVGFINAPKELPDKPDQPKTVAPQKVVVQEKAKSSPVVGSKKPSVDIPF